MAFQPDDGAIATHYKTVRASGLEIFYREAGPRDAQTTFAGFSLQTRSIASPVIQKTGIDAHDGNRHLPLSPRGGRRPPTIRRRSPSRSTIV
jgi:hypothetical protein